MASFFARESANNIKLKFQSPNKLSVIASSPHLGDNVSEVTSQIKGDDLEIAFNAKFILDVLQGIREQEITLELSSSMAAGLIKGIKDTNYLYVIMPLRIEE